jgi:hypothetical protein
MSDSNSYGFGGKLIVAVVLALLAGYVWACVEEHRNPLAILKMFSGKEEPEVAKAPAPKKQPPKEVEPAPVKKPEVVKPAEPVAVKKPEPVAPPPGPKTYSAVDMSILFNETDDLLRRGKLFEAHDKIANTSRLLIPQESLGQFSHYEGRVGRYHSLLLETTKGGTIEMPKMTQVILKNGNKLVVKVLTQDRDTITYETLTGIRSRISKDQCEEIKALEPVYGRVEVSLELKKQADYKGLIVEQEPGKPLSLKEKSGRKVTSLQIFDLADFCARNGANDKLVPLFDEALARDGELLSTVHEAKAARMIDVLVYFLTIKATYDARKTLDILKERYVDSKAYKEAIANDAEFVTNMDLVLNKRTPQPIARTEKATLPPKPVQDPTPSPTPAPATAEPKTPEAPVVRPSDPPDAAIRVSDPGTPAEVTSVPMPDGTNDKINSLVARGDSYFKKAMEHLNNCDPRIKPESAGEENKAALKLFLQANAEGYLPAQDEFKGGSRVPEPLLDRVREATQRSYFCRKFAVSIRK